MKKCIYRIGAFALDSLIAIIIIVMISSITFLNPKLDEISERQEAFNYEFDLYNDLKSKTENYIKDNKINQFEYQEILDDFPTYYELFKDVVIDEELSDDFKDNIEKRISEQYQTTANDYNYTVSKLSLNETIISIIVYMLYFGVLPFVMDGKTPAKKLLRLKVVDKDDETKKVPLWKHLVKAFLICEILFTLINLTILYTQSKGFFIAASYWVSEAKYIYEIAFLICLIIRDDQRSIHDLLLGTTVIRLDKNGNKIPDTIYPEIKEEEKEEVREPKEAKKTKTDENKKNTSKRTSSKKVSNSSKKEEVKAEKVND